MNTTKKITLIGLSLSLCLFATACAKGAKAEDGGNKPVEVVETQKTSNELNQEAKIMPTPKTRKEKKIPIRKTQKRRS